MPARSHTPCQHPGCATLVRPPGLCAVHVKARHARIDAQRGTAHERGYTLEWHRESRAYLRAHPMCLCPDCKGQRLPATVVDHKVPHRGDMRLFWDVGNWQPMAKACHDRKTALEDGGFGMTRGMPDAHARERIVR